MAAIGYACKTEAAVALVAATAKSILGVKGHDNFGLHLKGLIVAFEGVTASAVPVLVELCYSTWATKSPGTNSTTVTPVQLYGRILAHGLTAARDWTSGNEPTVLTPIKEFLLTPNGGALPFQFPLGQEPDCGLDHGFVIRCTAPAAVSVRATLDVERV